jgi:hypothetical protein
VALTANRVVQLSAGRITSDQSVEKALAHQSPLATQVASIYELDGLISLEQVS